VNEYRAIVPGYVALWRDRKTGFPYPATLVGFAVTNTPAVDVDNVQDLPWR
jgi:hypothetical protein